MVDIDVGNLWDFGFLWELFEFFTKLVSPFVMIAVGILSVGALLLMIVIVVKMAVSK